MFGVKVVITIFLIIKCSLFLSFKLNPMFKKFCKPLWRGTSSTLGSQRILRSNTISFASTSAYHNYDRYLFGDSNLTSWNDLGILHIIAEALESLNKGYATSIQAACYQPVLSGQDCVIGAETGCGKTLAYLVPLFQKLIQNNITKSNYPTAIILVPNKELCNQVNSVANSVASIISEKGLDFSVDSETFVSGDWPYRNSPCPQVIICTPAFLASFVNGPLVLEEELYRNLKYIVLDEADMLLEGSYLSDIEKIYDAMKVTRRQMIREGDIEVHEKTVQTILSAATLPTFGTRSIDNYVKKRFPNAIRVSNQHMHKLHPRIHQDFIPLMSTTLLSEERVSKVLEATHERNISAFSADKGRSAVSSVRVEGAEAPPPPSSNPQISSGEEGETLEDLIAAEGDSVSRRRVTARAEGRSFAKSSSSPSQNNLISDAKISIPVSQKLLRAETPQDLTVGEGLAAVATSPSDSSSSSAAALTMIFVNTAENAVQFAEILQNKINEKGLEMEIVEFHKLVDSKQREKNLARFRTGDATVMVCTDAAARGLDLPSVRHVIQAEFAQNVVQHLHRVGRASRAGMQGRASNFYDERSKDLVTSILADAGDRGSGEGLVEQAFSRRRGFRQKIKKAGANYRN